MSVLKKIEPETGWLEFTLADEKLLSPPVFRCKLRPSSGLDGADIYEKGVTKMSDLTIGMALAAVSAWDLTEAEAPIPCNDAEKMRLKDGLRMLMVQPLAGGGFLAMALLEKAQAPESFLGN